MLALCNVDGTAPVQQQQQTRRRVKDNAQSNVASNIAATLTATTLNKADDAERASTDNAALVLAQLAHVS